MKETMTIDEAKTKFQKNENIILYDLSSLAIRTLAGIKHLMVDTGFQDFSPFYYVFFENIITLKHQFNPKQIIFCVDKKHNKKYWRSKYFEHYKHNRKNLPPIIPKEDMDRLKNTLNDVLHNITPYIFIEENYLEGDDIIASLSKHLRNQHNIIIASCDHDFHQLCKKNTFLYDLSKRRFTYQTDLDYYIFEHIVKGDAGDGIPNILSDEDTFTKQEKRQNRCSKKYLRELYNTYLESKEDFEQLLGENINRWNKNKKLVDLTNLPAPVYNKVIDNYENYINNGSNEKFRTWLIKNRLTDLYEKIY